MEFKNPTEIDWDKAPLDYLLWSLVFILMVIIKYWVMGASYIVVLDLILMLIAVIFSIKTDFQGFSVLAWNHYFYSLPILILLGGYTKDIKLFFYRRRLQQIVDKSNKEFNDPRYSEPKPLDYIEPKKREKRNEIAISLGILYLYENY
jgi:hypothetical protein